MNAGPIKTISYCLQFKKNDSDIKNVNFNVNLSMSEIDSLTFLFSKYFNQNKFVAIKGLTFFEEFNKCVDYVKRDFDNKQQNNDIKNIFSVFLKHEFMGQVPHFRKIMQYLQKYLKPITMPSIIEINANCNSCSVHTLSCAQCKMNYLSACITTFDKGIQDGWDIFLRPMFGLPLFMYVLIKTDYDSNGIFNVDDLITNSFAQFLRNLLSDKAWQFTNHKTVQSLIDECRRVSVSLNAYELEFLLCMLRNKNSCDMPMFHPFKQFIIKMSCKTKIKQSKINKIASVVFTGFYLRLYLESASPRVAFATNGNKSFPFSDNTQLVTPFELELRNVCRFIMPSYDNEKFEAFINKLASIKKDLHVEQYIVTEKHIRQLVTKYNLDEDFAILLNHNV